MVGLSIFKLVSNLCKYTVSIEQHAVINSSYVLNIIMYESVIKLSRHLNVERSTHENSMTTTL